MGAAKVIKINNIQSKEMSGAGAGAGMTLIEVVVSLALLITAVGALWYGFGASRRFDGLRREKLAALDLVRSEMERVRVLPAAAVGDTGYRVERPGFLPMNVVRRVANPRSRDLGQSGFKPLGAVAVGSDSVAGYSEGPLEIHVFVVTGPRQGDLDDPDTLAGLWALRPDYSWY